MRILTSIEPTITSLIDETKTPFRLDAKIDKMSRWKTFTLRRDLQFFEEH